MVDDDFLPLFADSGWPGDDLHLVRLRDAASGGELGRIRGALPDSFTYGGVVYVRSQFTQRGTDGQLEQCYRSITA